MIEMIQMIEIILIISIISDYFEISKKVPISVNEVLNLSNTYTKNCLYQMEDSLFADIRKEA